MIEKIKCLLSFLGFSCNKANNTEEIKQEDVKTKEITKIKDYEGIFEDNDIQRSPNKVFVKEEGYYHTTGVNSREEKFPIGHQYAPDIWSKGRLPKEKVLDKNDITLIPKSKKVAKKTTIRKIKSNLPETPRWKGTYFQKEITNSIKDGFIYISTPDGSHFEIINEGQVKSTRVPEVPKTKKTKTKSKKTSETTPITKVKRFWCNDGSKNHLLEVNKSLPKNWVKGRIKKDSK